MHRRDFLKKATTTAGGLAQAIASIGLSDIARDAASMAPDVVVRAEGMIEALLHGWPTNHDDYKSVSQYDVRNYLARTTALKPEYVIGLVNIDGTESLNAYVGGDLSRFTISTSIFLCIKTLVVKIVSNQLL